LALLIAVICPLLLGVLACLGAIASSDLTPFVIDLLDALPQFNNKHGDIGGPFFLDNGKHYLASPSSLRGSDQYYYMQ
jgi:hypothetical protein